LGAKISGYLKNFIPFIPAMVVLITLSSCNFGNEKGQNNAANPQSSIHDAPSVVVPEFNADSAYSFVQKQVDFGPRIPNTPAQEKCALWLYSKLKQYTPQVEIQEAKVSAYDGINLKCKNIIAYLHPELKNRIVLFSHWDTRPWADEDSSEKYKHKTFDGANDGPSGVGVILEIARQLASTKPGTGVTIVFLDAEDYGVSGNEDSYCLGTQYWANHLDKSKYLADYGILLDMVGAPGSRFMYEGTSSKFAPDVLPKIWNRAAALGFGQYFIARETSPITDDHVYINTIAQLPTIDIVDYDASRIGGFGYYWHTHYDDMKVIDKEVLKAVGQTLLSVIFNNGNGS
jgi:glutaminyl-peptide cyclotransferase